MIKCNVTVCGTISRQAQMRANKEGKQFISFGISVVVQAKTGINKTIEISVAKDGNNQAELVNYPIGSRVEVAGVLQFHKKGDVLYLNLSALGVNSFNAGNQDAITGSIEFRGTIGKQVEVKTDKKGKPYTMFSAYSSEKDGENYSYTWVRFMQFDTQKADLLHAKAFINSKCDLQVGAYNYRLDLTCRITDLTPWEKKSASTNQ